MPHVSFRRLFPYFATLSLVGGIAAVFAFRPTPFIGLTPEAVARSLDAELGPVETECEEIADGEWSCSGTGTGGGTGTSFDLEINAFGCWTAAPRGGTPSVGVPREVSGCVTVWDH